MGVGTPSSIGCECDYDCDVQCSLQTCGYGACALCRMQMCVRVWECAPVAEVCM